MGILSELFVATDEEAITYEDGSAERLQSVQFKGLTNLEFELLWAILDGEEWNPDTHALQELRPSGETWTFKFPTAYVARLRELDRGGISAAAKQWAATEELSCKPSDVEPVISALVSLALSADGRSRSVFLWGSL